MESPDANRYEAQPVRINMVKQSYFQENCPVSPLQAVAIEIRRGTSAVHGVSKWKLLIKLLAFTTS